jgi:hypothetical protein
VPGQAADNAKPMKRFQDLTRKLVAVPKHEIDEKRAESKKRKPRSAIDS